MSRRFDRSRSPLRRGSKEWIAKQIVVFGRYADKRPRGLAVNCGSMTLSNLMDTWGDQEGVRSSKVLEALKMNMTQHDGGSRFEIERLENDVRIIVNPRCGGSSHREPLQRRQRAPSIEDQLSLKHKMSMDLDEIIANERGSSSRSMPKAEVIDLEAPDFDLEALKPPPGQSFACTGWSRRLHETRGFESSSRHDAQNLRHDHGHKVKVSKFVSYVIKRGHTDLGVHPWEGWINLHDLVRVVHQERYGNYTLQDLKDVLQDTDDVGRFRYWNDWVRKVDKADRQSDRQPQHPPLNRLPLPPVSSSMDVDSGLDANLTRVSHSPKVTAPSLQPPSVNGLSQPVVNTIPPPSVNSVSAVGPSPVPAEGRPPPPPGIGWTQYNDDGKFWWYYEGPQGKWWCDDDNEPMPWTFDD
mmetsp:Transcript_71958/g.112670  ORF Transcript_71958/g.112670 Transcript_71958/m.112670 type:complete len:411 (-) Transcript_71958:159-1391(-)